MKKLANIGGVISGIVSIVYSMMIQKLGIGGYESFSTYGGDAYTGIQNAGAQTANNVQALAKIVQTGLSGLLLAVGIALICFFLTRLLNDQKDAMATKSVSVESTTNK